MVTIYFILFSSLFFTLVIGGILSLLFKKEIIVSKRINHYFSIDTKKEMEEIKQKKQSEPKFLFLKTVSDQIKKFLDKKTASSRKKDLEKKLREAGYPLKLTPIDFRFLQFIIGGVLFFIIYLLLTKSDANPLSSTLLAGIVAALGMYYPAFYLSVIIKKRRHDIQKKMPDFFDMVNLSIEAGMGLDASLFKVCNQMKGPLSEEFLQTLEDMKLGKSRREAFSDLRVRVPVHQFQGVITSLIQADMLGVGMAKVLRTLTERIREQRTQFAREQAMKAPVKMVFPMMLFIFPAIFIVLMGPLIIYLIQNVF
ncbi:type II secretion system F family protein [Lederbergia citri]|uniref:Type II secretion system F family protein n=1 Tax=Lederbergia citri TaxID=2833580 RepID=A0A942TE09_9BACI|nr:type II secretion system F family protein [Lederbergia citri]MBS4196140.1 type II secretion system F family protein [Lederbergia citri]